MKLTIARGGPEVQMYTPKRHEDFCMFCPGDGAMELRSLCTFLLISITFHPDTHTYTHTLDDKNGLPFVFLLLCVCVSVAAL